MTTNKPTIKVPNTFTFDDCDKKCKTRLMIGRSWWKLQGYNSPCLCLKNKVILEYDSDTEDSNFDLSHCVNCRINRSLSSCVCETEDTEDSDYEYDYCNYGTESNPRFGSVSYQVAGGGMMNGNAYATVELKDKFYWYCEYGGHPNRKKIGTNIVWSDEIYDKKNPYECRSFDVY